jgi:hypothetical protein
MKYKKDIFIALIFFVLGAFISLLLLLWLRMHYYALMDYKANIHPGIAFFFTPLILGVILAVALPMEFFFRRDWYKPRKYWGDFVLGCSYVTILLFWAFRGHWWINLFINPIVIRWIFRRFIEEKNPETLEASTDN